MKIEATERARQWRTGLAGVALAAALSACGGGGAAAPEAPVAAATEVPEASTAALAAVAAGTPASTEGRLLASNCFQCHGTNGTGGFEEIRGKSVDELLEYQRKSAAGNIMAAHIQGYTPEQLDKIAAYLKK